MTEETTRRQVLAGFAAATTIAAAPARAARTRALPKGILWGAEGIPVHGYIYWSLYHRRPPASRIVRQCWRTTRAFATPRRSPRTI